MRRRTGYFFLLALLFGAVSCNRDPEVVKRKYVENGNKYFERGKYKEASIMYRSALKKDQRYGEAYYRLGLTQLKLNQPVAAVASLRRAVELQPNNDNAAVKLADLYLAALVAGYRDTDQLKNDINDLANRLLKKNPNSFDGNRLVGHLLLRDGKMKEAIERFRKADAAKPHDPDLILALSQALANDGQMEEAEQLSKALIQARPTFGAIYDSLYVLYARQNRLEDAEHILRLRIHNNPKVSTYRLRLAGHYYVLQRRDEAEKVLREMTDRPQEFPFGLRDAGDFYLRFRNFDRAIQYYEAGVQKAATTDDRLTMKHRLAEAFNAWGKKAEAMKVTEEILKENPKDDVANAMRASLLLDTGSREQLQEVLNDLEASITRMPNNPVVRYNLGRAYWAKGEIDNAQTQFRAAINMRPDYLAPRLALAQLHINRQEWAAALQAANETLAIAPTNPSARLLRAIALRGMGNFDGARAELQGVIERDPGSIDARFQLGMLELSRNNFKQAETSFESCMKSSGTDLRCLVGLAETYSSQKEFDKAVQLLEDRQRKMPDRSEIPLAIANTFVRAGKYNQAVPLYKSLIGRDARSSELYLRLGETYRRMGSLELAIDSFRKAKNLKPNDPIVYIPLAVLLDGTGRKEEARGLYRQVLKLQPDNAVALNNLAYLITESGGDLDEALTMAQRARQRLPQDLNVADTLGWIYIKKNLAANAIQIYRELTAKDPNNPTFRYHMAMALFQKGDKPQAKHELQTALRNRPSAQEASKIRELMAKIG